MADSLDDEEEEGGRMPGERTPVPNGAAARDASPMPHKPAPPPVHPRESLDGEPIFAVGDDGERWSEDDDSPPNSSEGKRLTGKDA